MNSPDGLHRFLKRISFANTILYIVSAIMIFIALAMSAAAADVGQFRHSPPKLRPTHKTITVMVVDTGVAPDNSFIKPFLLNPVTPDHFDTHGHGTHVTSLILGGPGKRKGKSGVEFSNIVCDQVKIIPCKFYNPRANTKENLDSSIGCFRQAAELNVDLVNYSAGGVDSSPEEKQAIEALGALDILLVTAAGNEGSDLNKYPYYPAKYRLPNIVIVGSLAQPVDKFVGLRRFQSSNFGFSEMFWEIGEAVLGYTHINESAQYMTGTSQATALATNRILKDRCSEINKKKGK